MKRVAFAYLLTLLIFTFPAFSRRAIKPASTGYVPDEIIVKFTAESVGVAENGQGNDVSTDKIQLPKSVRKLAQRYRFSEARPLFRNFRKNRIKIESLLQKEKRFLTNRQRRIFERLKRADKTGGCPALERIYKIRVELSGGETVSEVLESIQGLSEVEYAELNHIVSAHILPNDPYYSSQWSLPKIEAPGGWDVTSDASKVIVGVVDTGVDYHHPDIDDNMWVNEAEYNGLAGVDDDGNGYKDDIYGYDFVNKDGEPDDDNGHGTHCAGVIAAEGNNGVDVTGLCWRGQIMAIKFLSRYGSGTDADAAEAIYYAAENGCDVISNSWGGAYPSYILEEAINYARSQGVIVVASAGNDSTLFPMFPASYDGVISVAATDRDDERCTFSNYGKWVDIAAPGLDILSLWKGGGTAFASGTSMSCPHVSGTCALMLSVYPEMSDEYLTETLLGATDPINPMICTSGRLNVRKAVSGIVGRRGRLTFDKEFYSCSDTIEILLMDSDLEGTAGHTITIETDGGDFETVTLVEHSSGIGIFKGQTGVTEGEVIPGSGVVEVSHNNIITATYFDANDGTGESGEVSAAAVSDCRSPVIFNVECGYPGRMPRVIFETDEAATAVVKYGSVCGGYTAGETSTRPAKKHTVKLRQIQPDSQYFFIIEAVDAAGNQTIDNNEGSCYGFHTTAAQTDINVPVGCRGIQEAVENCWDGRTVWVADGIYTEDDNRDIDFSGRSITVRSEGGPAGCIIDCNGSESNAHRGFIFSNGEDAGSVLCGLTIKNGFSDFGGGIYCEESSPVIADCVFVNNFAGAIGNAFSSSPVITSCRFVGNAGGGINKTAGAISNYLDCSPIIRDCEFIGNESFANGGAISNERGCDAIIERCHFVHNSSQGWGGAIFFLASEPQITSCYIHGNTAARSRGGGIACDYSRGQITNCVISGNKNGGGIYCYDGGNPVISNCLISGNQTSLVGGGICNSISSPVIRNCTITGNKASFSGGGMYNYYSQPLIYNSIFWDNAAPKGHNISQSNYNWTFVNYTDIEADEFSIFNEFYSYVGWGSGNLQIDPKFESAGMWVDMNEPNTIVEPNDPNAVWIEGDYHLLAESGCINGGDPNYAAGPGETDLDGRSRVLLGRVDMGCYEFNHIPVADGGPDQTAYAWIDGIAEVILDGSASYDDDGDELTYFWSWQIGSVIYEANGVNPIIELPVGRHIIKLVVNDGIEDSEPGYPTVTVIGPLEAELRIMPRLINRKSHGRFIVAWLQLPPKITKADIDKDYKLTMYPGEIKVSRKLVFTNLRKGLSCTNIFAFFDRRELLDAAGDDGRIRFDVVGRLKSGRYFFGHRQILIINRKRGPDKFFDSAQDRLVGLY